MKDIGRRFKGKIFKDDIKLFFKGKEMPILRRRTFPPLFHYMYTYDMITHIYYI